MKKILISALILSVISIALFTCQRQEEQKEKQREPLADESAIAVKLTNVKEGDYSPPIVSSGLITTGNESRLSFKIGGIISRIAVEEGQTVSKGQVLASLDLTEIDAQVAQAKNGLEKMKRDMERVQRLYRDSAATLEQVQNIQTGYDASFESFNIASFNKQYATIRSTSNGRVIRKFVNEGEQVGGGTPVLMINSAEENDWIVKIGLPDVDWVRVKKGDKALVRTDAYLGSFEAVVSLINEGADGVSGLYNVEVKIQKGERKLATGLVAHVEIVTSQKQRLKSIPIEAIVEGSGKQAFVFVTSDDLKGVKKLPVTIAFLDGDEVMILKGLENVSKVITAGSAFLTEFSTIRVAE